jgi:hypothetical protein
MQLGPKVFNSMVQFAFSSNLASKLAQFAILACKLYFECFNAN